MLEKSMKVPIKMVFTPRGRVIIKPFFNNHMFYELVQSKISFGIFLIRSKPIGKQFKPLQYLHIDIFKDAKHLKLQQVFLNCFGHYLDFLLYL